jgi:hypothetical protein
MKKNVKSYLKNENLEAKNKYKNIFKNSMKGLKYEFFKFCIPELIFQNEVFINRIIEGLKLKDRGLKPYESL